MGFCFGQHSWPFFPFYLYNVKEENTFYFENFEKSFFCFLFIAIFYPIFIYFLAILMGLLFIFPCILWERKTQIWRNSLGKKVTKWTLQAWDSNFHKVSFLSISSCLFLVFMIWYLQLGIFFNLKKWWSFWIFFLCVQVDYIDGRKHYWVIPLGRSQLDLGPIKFWNS